MYTIDSANRSHLQLYGEYISEDYDPLGAYAFENWKQYFNDEIRGRYETLHEDLLYTSNRQSFEKAIQAFEFISHLFASIGE